MNSVWANNYKQKNALRAFSRQIQAHNNLYNHYMKNTAWKEGDDEIETYEQESAMTKIVFSILIIVIIMGFFLGNMYLKSI